MKKLFKISTSLLLTSALTISLLPAAYAEENLLPEEQFSSQLEASLPPGNPAMEETYDKYLIDHRYPQEVIDMYDIDQKRELYDLGGIYIGGSGIVKNHIEAPINSDVDIPNYARPLALQDNNFTHAVTASRIRSSKRGLVDIKLNYNWDWKYAPFFTGKDTYAVGWTGGFIVRGDTAQQVYKVFGSTLTGYKDYESEGKAYTRYDHINNGAGVGWDVNLVNSTSIDGWKYMINRHKGWSGVKFQKGHDNSKNTEVIGIVGDYWHFTRKVDPSLSWSTKDGVSISVSISKNYTKATTSTSKVNFTHSDYIVQ